MTAAETRVLAEIIGGDGLLAAAARLKITEATARSHANRILAKTGTSRQTELIRRFFESTLPGIKGSFDDTAGGALTSNQVSETATVSPASWPGEGAVVSGAGGLTGHPIAYTWCLNARLKAGHDGESLGQRDLVKKQALNEEEGRC